MLKDFGTDLKKLREFKGISLAEISAESRINPKFLQYIENGIFDFQPETYIRSFIKAYARAIDENEHQMLNEYDKAKAGFYARRKFKNEDGSQFITPEEKLRISVLDQPKPETELPVYAESIRDDKPDYMKPKPGSLDSDDSRGFSGYSLTRKILFVVLILAVITGVYYLVDYLNNSGDKKSDVTPKSFNEISSDYENKINPKIDSARIKDSINALSSDSLRLMIKALKDIKIKVYIDNAAVPLDENIREKDSIIISAKEKFRFSANANQSVEIYLNGKYLRKPSSLSGTSIKNLMINKEGIVTQ
jgi:transcriptional regulator with XRE-family HTH domain